MKMSNLLTLLKVCADVKLSKEQAQHLADLIEKLQQHINELEAQLNEREWISVEDNLPPIDVWVLWFDGDRTMNPNNTQYHIDKINERGGCLMNYLHNYTHWMPIPQPPKDKDHE